MWNPFKKRVEPECAIQFYLVNKEDVYCNFQFSPGKIQQFCEMIAAIQTGQFHDMVMHNIVEAMESQHATPEQIETVLEAINDMMDNFEEEEEDENEPLISPANVFTPKKEECNG